MSKKTDAMTEFEEALDTIVNTVKLLKVTLHGGKVKLDKASTRASKAKNKEGKHKYKASNGKGVVHKRTAAIVKKLEKYGLEVVKVGKTTWHIMKDEEKVGVVKPEIGRVEKLKNTDEGVKYKRVKVGAFKPKRKVT